MTSPRIDDLAESLTAAFEAERPRLVGIAYRMLGTFADAEDVVQEAWLRWQAADPTTVERPAAWLTTVTTRLSLDRLRTVQRRREDYVGPWLPEPIVEDLTPEGAAELADSLTLGFLTVLDRLGPVERAVFLLVDVFGSPYSDVAATVGKSEAACRQIASRARRRLQEGSVGTAEGTDPGRRATAPSGHRVTMADRMVIGELVAAVLAGDIDGVLARLSPDVVFVSDGGPNRHAARRPVVGADRVARFITTVTNRGLGGGASFAPATINGLPGFVARIGGAVDLVSAFEVRDGKVCAIWTVSNPDKLTHVDIDVAVV